MKKTLKALFTLAIATVVFISCGGNKTKELLVKKWQISDYKVDGMDQQMAQMKAAADTTKDSTMKAQFATQLKMFEGAMEEIKKSTMEWKKDGVYEASISMMGQTQNMKGTWTLSKDGKKVIIVDDKQKTDSMNVDELTSEKFVSSSVNNGKKSTIVLVPAK